MRLLFTLLAAIALSVPALSAQQTRANSSAAETSSDLSSMPEITLQDFDGKRVTAADLRGNILVLDFWATWCAPCIKEIPIFNQLQEKYAARRVKVIGVTMASGPVEEVKPFTARHNMKYTILMGDDEQSYDFNVFAFPTTFVVTRDLKIYKKYIGVGPNKNAQIEADIQKLLEQETEVRSQ
jgi:peroxiredoxin